MQHCGNAVGADDIMAMETLIYDSNRLLVHLCLLCNVHVLTFLRMS